MAWQDHITWMWNGYGDCGKPRCFFFVVESGPPPILRGTASPHTCVENAVREERKGNHNGAIRWLQAGQSHDEQVQREIAENRDRVLPYIISQYGNQISYAAAPDRVDLVAAQAFLASAWNEQNSKAWEPDPQMKGTIG